MRVRVRAVIMHDRQLVVRRERRIGRERIALPGGRVKDRESVLDALRREVAEETGLDVEPRGLLYVAEVVFSVTVHHLELIFLGEPRIEIDPGRVDLVSLQGAIDAPLLPPVAAEIVRDHEHGWSDAPRWLGNVWDARLARERDR